MDSVIRAASIYIFLLIVFRIAGRRTLAETSTFDLALLLVISEAAQSAMVGGDDSSLTTSFIIITTLILIDIVLAWLKSRSTVFDHLIEDQPVVILTHGVPNKELMKTCRITENDILAAARRQIGLENLTQIKYAVLEAGGQISIIPEKTA